MPRTYVEDLKAGQTVQQAFLVQSKQLRTQRSGALFLTLELADRTGVAPAVFWDATQSLYEAFDEGDFVLVKAHGETYRRRLQLVVTDLRRLEPADVDIAEFVPATKKDVAEMLARLREIADTVAQPQLQALLAAFLDDEAFIAAFRQAPAGLSIHHAWLGGLLEHTLAVTEMALETAERYPNLNRDLLVAGAVLHDIGKIEAFEFERGIDYSDAGRLVGHLPIGVRMVEAKARALDDFPTALLDQLRHLILSHHGEHAYGSPTLPATAEAIALHFLDNLDAKLVAFEQALLRDQNPDSAWTDYNRVFERRLFKPRV
ncbi:MAG: 3'-5' exoribonuclease YhaM family protein [Planctomycetota bacterium]